METSSELEVVAEEHVQDVTPSLLLLPLCEANRSVVVDPTVYAANIVFSVGALKLIDKAP